MSNYFCKFVAWKHRLHNRQSNCFCNRQGKVNTTDTTNYEVITLANGLRCVFRRSSGVAYCGIVTGAGSRDECAGQEGLAHFVEHTLFKGTTRRRSWHIAAHMESIGGELNAYTTKEETMVYTVAPHGYLPRAVELLADVVCDSVFPSPEIDREREVVIDEINSYLDSPADAVYDEFEDLLYAGSSLGHNILGTPDTVRALSGADCRNFIHSFYTPRNMVVYCVADATLRQVRDLMDRHFGHLDFPDASPARTLPPVNEPFDITHDHNRHQAHTLMGCRMFSRNDPRRFALFLLNNYIGGPCMNSRLNREMREKRGYVYSVDSSVGLLSDCGAFLVYFGCDREHIASCKRIVDNLIAELAETPMKPRIFEQIRRQYLGQLEVAASHAESRAMALGKSMLYYGRVQDINDSIIALRNLRPENLTEIARMMARQPLSTLTLM